MIGGLGVLLAVIGGILLLVGYIAVPAAVRPGWICLGFGAVLILAGYLLTIGAA